MSESPENDSSQPTPPLQPFIMPSQPEPDPTPAWAAGAGPAAPGAVPAQPGPPPAQPQAAPAAGVPAHDPWAVPGQQSYGQAPPPAPGYGSPHAGYQAYPNTGYQPYPAGPGGYQPVGQDPALALWWQRLLARVIDYVVVVVVTSPIWAPVLARALNRLQNVANQYPNPSSPVAQAALRSASNSFVGQFALIGLATAVVWFAYDWLQHGLWGQTLGKRALGTKVVRAQDRGRISAGAAAARAAVFALPPVVPTVGILFQLVNCLSLTWDKRRQCFHDKAGRTIVVKKSSLR